MQKVNFTQALNEILHEDSRFDREAYQFVREGLDYTMKNLKKGAKGLDRHVSGQELLEGLRRYGLEQYGPMTRTLLNHWGVRCCEDFGEIVFKMVSKGVLGKSEKDGIEDFRGGYSFEEAFVKPFRPKKRIQKSRTKRTSRLRIDANKRTANPNSKLSSGSP